MTPLPIETAPRDGTWISVLGSKPDVSIEWWASSAPDRPATARGPLPEFTWPGLRAYWCTVLKMWRFGSFAGGYFGGFEEEPTHWQPLPELPKQFDD